MFPSLGPSLPAPCALRPAGEGAGRALAAPTIPTPSLGSCLQVSRTSPQPSSELFFLLPLPPSILTQPYSIVSCYFFSLIPGPHFLFSSCSRSIPTPTPHQPLGRLSLLPGIQPCPGWLPALLPLPTSTPCSCPDRLPLPPFLPESVPRALCLVSCFLISCDLGSAWV